MWLSVNHDPNDYKHFAVHLQNYEMDYSDHHHFGHSNVDSTDYYHDHFYADLCSRGAQLYFRM